MSGVVPFLRRGLYTISSIRMPISVADKIARGILIMRLRPIMDA